MVVGRPPLLSREDFIGAARALLEESGADGLTTRALGQAMGVDPTSLYRHFVSREELLVAVLDSILSEVFTSVDVESGTPRERLRRIGHAVRDGFGASGRSAALAAAITSAQPYGQFGTQLTLQLLREMGVAEADLAPSYQALESLVLGTTALDYTGAPDHAVQRARRFQSIADPALAAVGADPSMVDDNNTAAFTLSLDALLDAIETRARR